MTTYGVTTDYEHKGKRQRLRVWSGPFYSVFGADALMLPRGDGFMLTTYNGHKIRVESPAPRNDANYQRVDTAISHALAAYNRQED